MQSTYLNTVRSVVFFISAFGIASANAADRAILNAKSFYVSSVSPAELTDGQSAQVVQIPKGTILTDIIAVGGLPGNSRARVSLTGSEAEIGDAGELSLYLSGAVSDQLMRLESGLRSRGTLQVTLVCDIGPCRNKILLTGYKQ